ncbi:MAG: hypothetical protein ACD_20C00156G0002 [uncultured bacterium]|nr:MAG: hypothetical protein ACD_20C00156G0002 [uncultured bacterium]HBH18585.1 hypothetical protein [Cyanobacteria bacterium UBA9579]
MESNLSCDDIKILVSAYFDNELSEEEARIVDNHLSKCALCAGALENIKDLSGLLKGFSNRVEYKESNTYSAIVDRVYTKKAITCSEVLDELSAYFDGELNLKLHYLIDDHLNTCSSCKSEFSKIEKLSTHIKSSFNISKELNLWPEIETDLNNIDICKEISENLSAFLDKELTRDDTIQVSEHLLTCKHCRRDYENLKATQFAIRNYFKKSISYKAGSNKDICDNTLVRLDKKERRKELFTSIASVFIIALLSWFSMNTVEPMIMKKAYGHNPKVVNPDRPVFVKYAKAEEFVFTQAYSMPPEGVESILYEIN